MNCDLILGPLQAQKIFGNRWTEIAKVVSGRYTNNFLLFLFSSIYSGICPNQVINLFFHCLCRTDNAVKNRFSTLCKKRAKHEALAKENSTSYINSNNKRALFNSGLNAEGTIEDAVSLKKMRYKSTRISAYKRQFNVHGV